MQVGTVGSTRHSSTVRSMTTAPGSSPVRARWAAVRVSISRAPAAASSSPQDACELLAPATLESLQSDGEDCAEAVTEAAPEGSPAGEPSADVYGRDAMVRWGGTTLFLARFDDGWLVTAAGCEPRGDDLPYDCSIEGR